MFFTPEVHADQEYKADTALVNKKELDLANLLVKNLEAEFQPEKYRDTYRDSYREEFRDIDVNVSLRDVPHSVLAALDCERHGPIETVQFVRRSGQEFYRFGVDERRGAQTVIRIGANGRLLTVGEQEARDPGYAFYRR